MDVNMLEVSYIIVDNKENAKWFRVYSYHNIILDDGNFNFKFKK